MGERLMTIYIDADCKCHTAPGVGLTAVETDAFEDKCSRYIQGYRFVPAGESWTREDGHTFTGEMIAPWRDYAILAEFQSIYEEELAKAVEDIAALVGEVYNSDLEVIENV